MESIVKAQDLVMMRLGSGQPSSVDVSGAGLPSVPLGLFLSCDWVEM